MVIADNLVNLSSVLLTITYSGHDLCFDISSDSADVFRDRLAPQLFTVANFSTSALFPAEGRAPW